MPRRFSLSVASAFVLCVFALLAAGTSSVVPPAIGEFPLALHAEGDKAYLAYMRTPRSPGPKSLLKLAQITEDARTTSLFEKPMEERSFHAAVTETPDGPLALVLTKSKALIFDGARGLTEYPIEISDAVYFPMEIKIIRRDQTRLWAYVNRPFFGPEQYAPLFEIAHGKLNTKSTNIVWVTCGKEWCQKLSVEKDFLRLYASPISTDAYEALVTEVTVSHEDVGYFACENTDSTVSFTFGDHRYQLSTTLPSMKFIGRAEKFVPDCVGEKYRSDFRVNTPSELDSRFESGARIEVRVETAGAPKTDYCDVKCSEKNDVFETRVRIYDTKINLIKSFVMHDL